jgi:hypothetical protein
VVVPELLPIEKASRTMKRDGCQIRCHHGRRSRFVRFLSAIIMGTDLPFKTIEKQMGIPVPLKLRVGVIRNDIE